jgi:FkbM family methyltransferase
MSTPFLNPFPQNNEVKECRYGKMIYNRHDEYVGRMLNLYGQLGEGESNVFRQIVKAGDVVVEVGANIGGYTLFLAEHVGPSGVVFAFEPQRILFQSLCGNMALNSIPNVFCFQQAVGSAPGQIIVPNIDYGHKGNFGGVALGSYRNGEAVRVVTLDSLGLARCNFIKCDVEGMEEEVLKGATATLARFRPILYVENDRVEKSESLIRYIHSLGYNMYWHRTPLFDSDNFFGNQENVFGNTISQNMLCVPSELPQNLSDFRPVEVPATT